MNFLVDESVGARIATWLSGCGHDATAVARDYPQSLPDEVILATAEQEGSIVITNDTDFGELVFRQRQPHAGVILLRLKNDTFANRCERLAVVLTEHADQLTEFLVVTDGQVRIHQR